MSTSVEIKNQIAELTASSGTMVREYLRTAQVMCDLQRKFLVAAAHELTGLPVKQVKILSVIDGRDSGVAEEKLKALRPHVSEIDELLVDPDSLKIYVISHRPN